MILSYVATRPTPSFWDRISIERGQSSRDFDIACTGSQCLLSFYRLALSICTSQRMYTSGSASLDSWAWRTFYILFGRIWQPGVGKKSIWPDLPSEEQYFSITIICAISALWNCTPPGIQYPVTLDVVNRALPFRTATNCGVDCCRLDTCFLSWGIGLVILHIFHQGSRQGCRDHTWLLCIEGSTLGQLRCRVHAAP